MLAYALPIVQMLSSRAVWCLRSLVVLPTRDFSLAVGQSSIADEIQELIKRSKLEAGICYDPEVTSLHMESTVDILVATPGKLMDHLNSTKGFKLEHLQFLVVDETDRLLREAYQSWLPSVPKLTRTSVGNFFPHANCHIPSIFDPLKTICETKLKPLYLVSLLQSLQGEKCIVFTSSVESTHRLCTLLNYFDDIRIKVKEYSGLQQQSIRSKMLKVFRAGKVQVLVSSDAMTRGMDVEGVRNVISYDMPPYIKTYIHCAGRTARAGQAGCCFTLLHQDDAYFLFEVKRFKKLLQKADNNLCLDYSIPSNSVESLELQYTAAWEKLKPTAESETHKKHKRKFGSSRMIKENE